MRKILLVAVSAALTAGVANAQKGDPDKGKEVFEQCAACHNTDTDEKKMGPSLRGLFKKEKLANGKKATEANVRAVIENGGNGMPGYADLLTAEEKAHVMAYLHTI
jgi:cytochrome c2